MGGRKDDAGARFCVRQRVVVAERDPKAGADIGKCGREGVEVSPRELDCAAKLRPRGGDAHANPSLTATLLQLARRVVVHPSVLPLKPDAITIARRRAESVLARVERHGRCANDLLNPPPPPRELDG